MRVGADFYIQMLMDLGEYTSDQAAKIYREQLKLNTDGKVMSERARAAACYKILEKRRQQVGLTEI